MVNCHILPWKGKHHAIHGKIHYFDWVIFNSFLYVHQRVSYGTIATGVLHQFLSGMILEARWLQDMWSMFKVWAMEVLGCTMTMNIFSTYWHCRHRMYMNVSFLEVKLFFSGSYSMRVWFCWLFVGALLHVFLLEIVVWVWLSII